MRIFAIINNVLAFIGFGFLFVVEWPHRDDEWIIFPFVVVFFVVNLFALYVSQSSSNSDNWLSLYFERKRLEEKKKIDQLKEQ